MVFNSCLERGFLLGWVQAAKFVPLSRETIFFCLLFPARAWTCHCIKIWTSLQALGGQFRWLQGCTGFHQRRGMTALSAARDPSGISSLRKFAFPQFHSGMKYMTLPGISAASGAVFCHRKGFRSGTIDMNTLNSVAVHLGCLNCMFPDIL